ncbi:hypothetical protein ACWTV9_10235 [Clostridioides difficile]
MKKFKIEDMNVIIRYTDRKVDKDKLYDIFANIIKRLELEKKEGVTCEKIEDRKYEG